MVIERTNRLVTSRENRLNSKSQAWIESDLENPAISSPLPRVRLERDLVANDRSTVRISVIIPTLNEAHLIRTALESTGNAAGVENIVVDGGSVDGTVDIARACCARIVDSPPGRACQMNRGADAASGELLVFLHADSRLPDGFDQHVRTLIDHSGVVAGAFQLGIDSPSFSLRMVERAANWRSRHLQLPYGDQAIFLEKKRFLLMGGFPNLPIMEDFEFVRRLRSQGQIVIAPLPVTTSARRWQRLGPFRTTFINQMVILAFYAGVNPSRLALWYRQSEE